ncbi:retrovirus-related pol polyprotein from transposon TNT 1-94 [Tanacetum coccineum]
MDVVFNENLMYKDTLKGVAVADSRKEVEFEVELQGSRVELTVDPHIGDNPGNEDEVQDNEEPQQHNLDNYVLVRDRAKRTIDIPIRYRDECNVSLSRPVGFKEDDDIRAYAFSIVEEEDTHEPITFQDAINASEKAELILSLTTCEDYELEHLDVKTSFLHGDLEETIYMRQSPGFEEGTGNKGSQTLKVSQSGYVQKILNNYKVDNGKLVSVALGAHFKRSRKHVNVDGFVDADYTKDPDKGRSITRYVFMVHGCVLSLIATLQHVVALSTTEVEYMALTEVVKESIWLKGLLIKLGINIRLVVVNCDNQGKEHNAADTFTKVVPGPKFKYCMEIFLSGLTSFVTKVEIVNISV